MTEKRALVTGAARRLGRAMALFLAERGHDVAIHHNRSGDAAEAVADEIRALGRRAATIAADLTREDEVRALLPTAVAALGGPLTLLVNNASVFEEDSLSTAPRATWDSHMESNLRAPVMLTRAFAEQAPPAIRDHRGEALSRALVVNIVDQRVLKPTPHFMSYTVSKMALWDFTRIAARSLAPNVRVNAIGPGPTLASARQTDDDFHRQRAACLLGRGSNLEDINGALGYFLDAPGVTGQLLCVDGGQHLAWKTTDAMVPE